MGTNVRAGGEEKEESGHQPLLVVLLARSLEDDLWEGYESRLVDSTSFPAGVPLQPVAFQHHQAQFLTVLDKRVLLVVVVRRLSVLTPEACTKSTLELSVVHQGL